MIKEIRLDRHAASLVHVERFRPAGALLLFVRYTRTQLVIVYRA
jgi:hypothetical protein